tara:strand:- start:8594 stop:8935 length:342 start_codon:yes stop_codon:yes gene_type:complete
MKQYTVKEIDDALREVMNKQPEFVYAHDGQSCYYYKGPTDNECDGCVFGQAFQLLGVAKEELQGPQGFDDSIKAARFAFLPPLVQRPRYWSGIQRRQDRGSSWGELLQFLPTT